MAMSNHAAVGLKILKLLINIIIVILYKHGDEGYFLGASFNKNRDSEALAAGVYVGYLIYNIIALISHFYDSKSLESNIIETLMNAVGFVLWLITAGVVIHFWLRFIPANHFRSENPNAVGIAMGALTIVNSALYLGETVVTYVNWRRSESRYDK